MSLSQEIHAEVFNSEVLCLELIFKSFRGREKMWAKCQQLANLVL